MTTYRTLLLLLTDIHDASPEQPETITELSDEFAAALAQLDCPDELRESLNRLHDAALPR